MSLRFLLPCSYFNDCLMPNESRINEKGLMLLVSQGNELAFATLFRYYRNRIYSIAYKLTHSHSLSEEIVQDVFLKIWLRRTDLNEIQNLSAYLFIITRNNVYKVLKQIARNCRVSIFTEEDHAFAKNTTADIVNEKEYNLLLKNAVERLPNQQKQVYKLIRDAGMKREEVATLLKLQPDTVKFSTLR